MQDLQIAILGAGPSGLTFARLLQKNGIPCTIYEAERDSHARDQGGSLDLHATTGQRALEQAGLLDEFKKRSRPEAQVMKLLKFDGHVVADENVSGNLRAEEFDNRPEIDRTALREMLLNSVEPGTIRWSHKVSSVERDSENEGKHTITFANGTRLSKIDLVVGADGAWSKARHLVTASKPLYSGIIGLELWAFNVSETNPELSRFIGAGTCFMFDEGRALLCQRNGNDSIRAYACVRQPQSWKDECGIDWSDPEGAREAMATRYFGDCAEDLKRVIRECKDASILRQMFMLPVGLRWDSQAGVTLLGDAAHLMTPFAGVGVNVALADAMELANALIARKESLDSRHSIDAAIREYEGSMLERAEQNAMRTEKGLKGHFSKDGAEELYHRATAKS